jgi:chemotaxis protein methyltransferase CheR
MTRSLTEVAELLHRETGIALAATKEHALRAALHRAAPGLEPTAFLSAASDPLRGRNLVARLIDEVTVQETTFARDRGQLDSIPWHSLLRNAQRAGSTTIRAWSAGCATGEEAYTLALLAAEAFAPVHSPVDVLGTDISGAAIAAAAAGRYRERAVRELEPALRRRYFERQADGTFLVGKRLRQFVRFRRHNLAREPVPPPGEAGFDIITCRNVLIYFEATVVGRVVELLDQSLRPEGRLLLGAADALQRTIQIAPRDSGPKQPARAAAGPCRQLGHQPELPRDQQLAAVLAAAGKGERDTALARVMSLLTGDPLDADAQFVYGLVTLEAGEPARAAAAFRRALYSDPAFAVAAFSLGCAYDALGDGAAARRAYEQALRTIDPADDRHELLLQQIALGDIAAACRTRLDWHGRTQRTRTGQ